MTMQDAFGTIIAIIIIIAVLSSASKKKTQQNGQTRATPRQPVQQSAQRPVQQAQPKQRQPKPAPAGRLEREPLKPTVLTAHDHDHPGSLGDLHDEGYDPCHEEQLGHAGDPALARDAEVQTASGLQLRWTGDELVRTFVMKEVLDRRH